MHLFVFKGIMQLSYDVWKCLQLFLYRISDSMLVCAYLGEVNAASFTLLISVSFFHTIIHAEFLAWTGLLIGLLHSGSLGTLSCRSSFWITKLPHDDTILEMSSALPSIYIMLACTYVRRKMNVTMFSLLSFGSLWICCATCLLFGQFWFELACTLDHWIPTLSLSLSLSAKPLCNRHSYKHWTLVFFKFRWFYSCGRCSSSYYRLHSFLFYPITGWIDQTLFAYNTLPYW